MDNFALCPEAGDFKTLVGDHAAKMAGKVNTNNNISNYKLDLVIIYLLCTK